VSTKTVRTTVALAVAGLAWLGGGIPSAAHADAPVAGGITLPFEDNGNGNGSGNGHGNGRNCTVTTAWGNSLCPGKPLD
jgi:hypothetical protein